jgi:hypothetical protein
MQPPVHRVQPPGRRAQPLRDRLEHLVQPDQGGLADRGPADHDPGDGQGAGCRQACADLVETVRRRLDRLSGSAQFPAQDLVDIEVAHASRSSTLRSADMALAVWLFTAPRLIPMMSAI